MQESIVAELVKQGLLGAIVVALGLWVIKLHRELHDEREARLKDVKDLHEVTTSVRVEEVRRQELHNEGMRDLKERRREIEQEREIWQRDRDREREDREPERGPRDTQSRRR